MSTLSLRTMKYRSAAIAKKGPKGIYFVKSFSNRPLLNFAGNLMADYNLTNAKLEGVHDAFSLKQNENYIEYALDPYSNCEKEDKLYRTIHRIDRAYATKNDNIFVTQIVRRHWPIKPVKCYHFATNFFKSAKFLGAFKVDETINYTWNDPVKV